LLEMLEVLKVLEMPVIFDPSPQNRGEGPFVPQDKGAPKDRVHRMKWCTVRE